jgi:hypothetical protein
MSGVGCVQDNCMEIANAKLSYTGACICQDGYSGCMENVDASGVACGPFCPSTRLLTCVDAESACPGDPPPAQPETDLGEPGPASDPPGQQESGQTSPTDPDLVRDLEEFLAGENARSPSAGRAAAAGAISATLLGTWVINQLLAGVPMEEILRAINVWRDRLRPGDAPIKPQSSGVSSATSSSGGGASATASADIDTPVKSQSARTHPPAQAVVPKRPIEEAEDHARRAVDISDEYVRGWEETRKDFSKLLDRLPKKLKESDFWKKKVQPQIDKILKTTDPTKVRKLIDETRTLLDIREPWKKAMRHVDPDKYEGGIWLDRGGRAGGRIASDLHRTLIIEPLKKWAGSLPQQQAEAAKKILDGHHKDIDTMLDDLRKAVLIGAQNFRGGKQIAEALDEIQEHQPEQYKEIREVWTHRTEEDYGFDPSKGLKKLEPIKKEVESAWESFRSWWDRYGLVYGRRTDPRDYRK